MKQRIGIVGGGQLGRMLGFAAKRLGFSVSVIDPTPQSPAGQVVDYQIIANVKDPSAIRKLAAMSDFITFEIELANAAILEEIALMGVEVNPDAKTLALIKDKLLQKQFLAKAIIPTAKHVAVETVDEIKKAALCFDYPVLLKARFDAYDGRGNALIRGDSDIENALVILKGRELYVEKFIPFVKELAVMVARSTTGEIVTYPVAETSHVNNICHTVVAPAEISRSVQQKAQKLAEKTMEHLKGAGVFGIEMFLTKKGEVLINEIAPRVHNSGHYTVEACVTSQFEQHIRAICGLPLGKTDMIVPAAVTVNILGDRQGKAQLKGLEKALAIPQVYVHIYGKAETKNERKMGHITATGDTRENAYNKVVQARGYIHI